ncbi:rhomboid-related protein 2 isoform X1 [Protopterus annectens]|uniref:rhomboid-related protein 2 isoform X1 n=1 Tax=Protopterus annectens TaxID=7888 RepID=UPI001CFA3010|nr:rhomboid-related protein 2 isoform X1 [Protopterus annectens]XP_043939367.1 rhomboid-related protein 2 isoform X1 [Protopterus annectens]XP_043939373.1 rhomboid-related protein 2 isoform X1 [Protopterus annectens]
MASGVEDPEDVENTEEEKEEEEGGEGGKCQACTWCDRMHIHISKWMLPEDLREKYLERANCIPPPLFILLISIAELGVFIYYAVMMPQKQWLTLSNDVLTNSSLSFVSNKRREAWRFVSYMLLHDGVQHILGNLVLQLVLGIPLEIVHKGHRVGMVYLAGVIGGSLASSIFDPGSFLVGASGGAYALMGGYFMNVLVNFKDMIPLFGIFRIIFIVTVVATDMGFALYRRFFIRAQGNSVSFVAHIAGGLAGMTIGYVVFSSFDQRLIKDPRFWVCLAAYLVCFMFAVFFNIYLQLSS